MLFIFVLAGLAPVLQPTDPWSASELAKLPPVGPDYFPGRFRGRITGFVKNGVTIRPEGDVIMVKTVTLPDKRIKPVAIYCQDNTRPPREFRYAEQFLEMPLTTHSLHEAADLCIGDLVEIRYARPVDLSTWVAILRRPGGKVPPAAGDKDQDTKSRHHTRCSAQQYVEEKVLGEKMPRMLAHLHR